MRRARVTIDVPVCRSGVCMCAFVLCVVRVSCVGLAAAAGELRTGREVAQAQ